MTYPVLPRRACIPSRRMGRASRLPHGSISATGTARNSMAHARRMVESPGQRMF